MNKGIAKIRVLLRLTNYRDSKLRESLLSRSCRFLASEWNWSPERVRRLLKRMKNEGILDFESCLKNGGKDVSRQVKITTYCNYSRLPANNVSIISTDCPKSDLDMDPKVGKNKEEKDRSTILINNPEQTPHGVRGYQERTRDNK